MVDNDLREQVRERYARAATAVSQNQANALTGLDEPCCPAGCGTGGVDVAFGSGLYSTDDHGELPPEAIAASLGCGNPIAVAELQVGEKVLDLGSGGGIDVLLSARRVGPTGFAYGVDMTDEMLTLAETNKAKSGLTNVAFLKGTIEAVPLPNESVDVVISNCVINLSTDKSSVLAEMFRVLTPGGRIGVSDVVADDDLTTQMRAERGSYVGCIAGALSRNEYLDRLVAAGFTHATVTYTHEVGEGMHAAIVNAIKPSGCCSPSHQASCCEPSAKAACCGTDAGHAAGTLWLPVSPERARKAAAEAVGTAFLVAAVIGSGIAAVRLSPHDAGLQLLENSVVTAAVLVALIVALQPVSAAFNPIVTLVERSFGAISTGEALILIAAQILGGVVGALAANVMFGLSVVTLSTHHRSGSGVLFAEVVATLGLLLVIFGSVRAGRADRVGFVVGGYILGAYWFTSSTSFANPAVTIARMFSNTFAGIAPASAPAFIAMQLIGGVAGLMIIRFLYPSAHQDAITLAEREVSHD